MVGWIDPNAAHPVIAPPMRYEEVIELPNNSMEPTRPARSLAFVRY